MHASLICSPAKVGAYVASREAAAVEMPFCQVKLECGVVQPGLCRELWAVLRDAVRKHGFPRCATCSAAEEVPAAAEHPINEAL